MYKHSVPIQFGVRGEISKIQEETDELQDAKAIGHRLLECADIVEAAGQYSRKHCRVPLILLVFLVYVRATYKPVRNLVCDVFGRPKHSFFPSSKTEESPCRLR